MAVFQPALPPTTPTSDNVFQGLLLTEADYVMTLPAFIEVMWSHVISSLLL